MKNIPWNTKLNKSQKKGIMWIVIITKQIEFVN